MSTLASNYSIEFLYYRLLESRDPTNIVNQLSTYSRSWKEISPGLSIEHQLLVTKLVGVIKILVQESIDGVQWFYTSYLFNVDDIHKFVESNNIKVYHAYR